MSKLNKDILYLLFKILKKDLFSCLLVNKTWCEIIVPIIWENPWNNLTHFVDKRDILLMKVIISHIKDEEKLIKIYNIQDHFFDTDSYQRYQRPLFDYISFCKHLNFGSIMLIIDHIIDSSERSIVRDEVFKLFINKNVKFTHLYIPRNFNFQIHLIPGARSCFSNIKFLRCYTSISNNILIILIEACKSIRELRLYIENYNSNYKIIKLIEAQKRLVNIHFGISYNSQLSQSDIFCNALENSLIKHAESIQYFVRFKPFTTEILSSLINLKGLELHGELHDYYSIDDESKWKYLENLSLPSLKFLKLYEFPTKYLIYLIMSTKGSLIEIEIYNDNVDPKNEKRIIQVIYQNCPNLEYLTFSFQYTDIVEMENLLITCQYLNGLHIITKNNIDLGNLFKLLTKISPISLYKFYFENYKPIKLETIKLFIDNWKGRRPMLLKLNHTNIEMVNLLKKYRLKGLIVDFDE
jgi:hypothetical protein